MNDLQAAGLVRWLSCLIALLALTASLSASSASAQRRPREAKQQDKAGVSNPAYRALIEEALREFEAGNWNEALALFLRAHAAEPNARTLRGIGFCLFEMRRYVDGVAHLEQAMADSRSPLNADQRNSTQQVLDRAKAFVAHVQVELRPESARLLVDGKETNASERLLALDPGEHELAASADDYTPRSLRIVVQSGQNQPITLDLSPVAAEPTLAAAGPVAPAEAEPTPAPSARTRLKRNLMISGFALAGAGLVSGAVTGILALIGKNDLNKSCRDDVCPPDQADELDGAKGLALGSSISFGIAALGAGIGLTGLLLPRAEKQPRASRRLELRASCTALTLRGTF